MFLVKYINFVLVFILLLVNDMEREEGLGKNLFYKKSTSHEALNLPVENNSTEISRGTLSSHPYHDVEISVFLFICFCCMVLVLEEGYFVRCLAWVIVVGVFSLLLGLVLLLCFWFL